MAVFFILLIIPVFLNLFLQKKQKTYMFLMFLVLFLVLALRDYSVGGDLVSYKIIFDNLYSVSALDYYAYYRTEPLFLFITRLIAVISKDDFRAFIVFTSFVYSLLLSLSIFHYSKSQWMSWAFVIGFGLISYAFSGIRAGLAMVLGLFGLKYLFGTDKNDKLSVPKYVVFCVLAFFTQYTSVVFLLLFPLLWLRKNKIKLYYLLFVFLLIISVLFGDKLTVALSQRFFSQKNYILESSGGLGLLIIALFFRVYLKIFTDPKAKDNNYSFVCMLFEMVLVCQILAFSFNLWSRISDFAFCIALVFVPNYITNSIFEYRNQKIVNIVIFIVLVAFFYRVLLIDSAGIVPYVFYHT